MVFAVCDFGFSDMLIFGFVAEEKMVRYKFEYYSFDVTTIGTAEILSSH
jgi:hypothetical protein